MLNIQENIKENRIRIVQIDIYFGFTKRALYYFQRFLEKEDFLYIFKMECGTLTKWKLLWCVFGVLAVIAFITILVITCNFKPEENPPELFNTTDILEKHFEDYLLKFRKKYGAEEHKLRIINFKVRFHTFIDFKKITFIIRTHFYLFNLLSQPLGQTE